MLSNRGRTTNNKDGLAGVFTASALFPSNLESNASGLRVVECESGSRECEGDRRCLVKVYVIWYFGGNLSRHDRVLLERGIPVVEVPLVQPES